jgi:amino acid adenylation domain-containing protein
MALDRSLEMAAGVLGVFMAGAACVPLDPAYPRERRRYMLRNAGVEALLVGGGPVGDLGEEGVRVIRLDAANAADADEVEDEGLPGLPEVPGGCLAYVLYTSGSTGRPKGIGLPHAALYNLIDWHLRHLLGGVRTLQFASLGFDASFHEMFACWGSGGILVVVPEELRRDVPALTGLLLDAGVEKAILPVVVLQRLAEEYEARAFRELPPLREVTTTGEQLQTTRAMAELLRRLGGCTFHNHYGPSESHVVTAFTLDPDPARWSTHPSIGLPIANARVHLLDARLSPVPLGVPGELAIGGTGDAGDVCLARGYVGRPDLTAERFVPDPLGFEPGARLYRTGDKVRRLADGNLDFLGRFDHQVKVRGFRVEPEEIESVLGGHPEVRQTAVLAREMAAGDRHGDRRLVAYVVPEAAAGRPGMEGRLRSFLRERLPDYMVPAHFVVLEALPLTPNGKVDRRALPAPPALEGERPELAAPYLAPRTPVEETLAAIWSDVLGVERVGVADDFFELGGHSLLATQAISRVRQAFAVEVPLRALFEGPTVRELALAVERARGSAGPEAPPIVPVPRTGDLPLSFAQQRLWFLDRLAPGNPFYNMFGAVRLAGRVDVAALRAACREIARRHEVLRTTFTPTLDPSGRPGPPVQTIAAEPPADLPLIDLGALPEAARRGELERLATAEGRRPFDLARGPVFRTALLRLGAAEHSLFFNLHHIASDGWSLGVLHREVAALYGAFVQGEPSSLPALPVQYADFAVWQRGWLQGEALRVRLDYWKGRLAGMPEVLELPTDRPRPAVESFRGNSQAFTLAAPLVRGLTLLARRRGATLSMAVLAGFKTLLARLSGRGDVAVGVAIANRNRREIEDLIGFFVNTLVLRTDVFPACARPPWAPTPTRTSRSRSWSRSWRRSATSAATRSSR